MRSLFLKIFLSFWMAQALFLVLAVLVTLAIRQQAESAWDAEQAQVLNGAVQAYETGGQAALARYLEQVRQSEHVRAYLLNENDEELSGRRLPEWAKDGERWRPPSPQGRLSGMDDGSATPASVHYFCERTSLYVGGASTSTWTFWRSRHTRAWNLHRNSFFRLGVLPARQILNLAGSATPHRDPETGGRRSHCPCRGAPAWTPR